MTQNTESNAELYYGLATPPSSPSREDSDEIRWPSTSLDDFLIKSRTQQDDNLDICEKRYDLSCLTPPVSPTKEKFVFQRKETSPNILKNAFPRDNETPREEDNTFLTLSHSDHQS